MNNTARTILQQLGGNKFVAMTGAKNLATNGNDLSFKIGRNPRGFTHCRITLNSLDLYDMTFIRIRKYQIVEKREWVMVYADKLNTIFEGQTGLRTSLEVSHA